MKRQYKFVPRVAKTTDGDFRLILQKNDYDGKTHFSNSFSTLSDATSALDFCRLAVFECCREDCIAPLPD